MAALAAVGGLVSAGLFVTGTFKIGRSQNEPAVVVSGDDVYTGSILYLPREGNVCRQFLFDNRTGRMQDNGPVDCERALYAGDGVASKRWSAARVLVISESFRQR
jgi:hypothetical protein